MPEAETSADARKPSVGLATPGGKRAALGKRPKEKNGKKERKPGSRHPLKKLRKGLRRDDRLRPLQMKRVLDAKRDSKKRRTETPKETVDYLSVASLLDEDFEGTGNLDRRDEVANVAASDPSETQDGAKTEGNNVGSHRDTKGEEKEANQGEPKVAESLSEQLLGQEESQTGEASLKQDGKTEQEAVQNSVVETASDRAQENDGAPRGATGQEGHAAAEEAEIESSETLPSQGDGLRQPPASSNVIGEAPSIGNNNLEEGVQQSPTDSDKDEAPARLDVGPKKAETGSEEEKVSILTDLTNDDQAQVVAVPVDPSVVSGQAVVERSEGSRSQW